MGALERVRRLFDYGPSGPQDEEPVTLLRLFIGQLEDEFCYALSPTAEKPVPNPEVIGQLKRLFDERHKQPLTWGGAYQMERLLVYVLPPSRLRNETDRRVADAERHQVPAATRYRTQLEQITGTVTAAGEAVKLAGSGAGTDAEAKLARAQVSYEKAVEEADNARRALLAAVIDDLQWFYQQRILKRDALWKSASRLLTLGILCLSIVALPFLAFAFGKISSWPRLAVLLDNFPNYGLFTAMSFGLLGAFFSRLISFQFSNDMTVEAAQNRYSYKSLAIRCGVGMCGAVIVYYLLQTEFIGTNYRPDFTKLGYKAENMVTTVSGYPQRVLMPSKDWCLLVLWSFLAGFSERLVPDTLARIDGELSGQKK